MKYILALIAILFIVFAVRLGELSTQGGRYQAYWNRRNQHPAQPNEILYIVLGDSTGVGVGADRPQNGYVGHIARELEKKFDRPVRVLNFSQSGARISDLLNRQLPKLEACNVTNETVITIEIGANDMSHFNGEKFEREMNELLSRLPKQTAISDLPYFGAGINRGSEPNVIKANKIIKELAKKHKFELVNLHERTKNNSGPRTFAADWFHPSAYGYKSNWVPAFMEQIDKGVLHEKI